MIFKGLINNQSSHKEHGGKRKQNVNAHLSKCAMLFEKIVVKRKQLKIEKDVL